MIKLHERIHQWEVWALDLQEDASIRLSGQVSCPTCDQVVRVVAVAAVSPRGTERRRHLSSHMRSGGRGVIVECPTSGAVLLPP